MFHKTAHPTTGPICRTTTVHACSLPTRTVHACTEIRSHCRRSTGVGARAGGGGAVLLAQVLAHDLAQVFRDARRQLSSCPRTMDCACSPPQLIHNAPPALDKRALGRGAEMRAHLPRAQKEIVELLMRTWDGAGEIKNRLGMARRDAEKRNKSRELTRAARRV